MDIHIVAPGDTIASIAARYGVSPSRLSYDNQLNEQSHLVVGQALLVLRPQLVHEVTPGDTPSSISSQYGISTLELLRNNPFLSAQPYLVSGEYLIIRYEGGKTGSIETDGYAYPFIDRPLLRQTLPYLTALSIFSYGFTPEGELIPVDDAPLIAMAREFDTRCVLVLTPFSDSGSFDNNLVTIVTNNLEVQNRVIENLLVTVAQKPYQEVDVDFEFIRAEDRIPYVNFVRNLTQRMNAVGVTVSVALAPKTSEDQPGLLYEGIDYRLLGEAANTVLLMTYEWGYAFGPPMAVAPIPQVRDVLDYAVSEIPPERISMGIPNYGYDWPLPFIRGVTEAENIGNHEAVEIAAINNVSIQYDEISQAPFFEYTRDGISHIVWFEDVRSIQAKLDLVDEYGFRGVDYWQLMRPFRQNWLLVNYLYHIIR